MVSVAVLFLGLCLAIPLSVQAGWLWSRRSSRQICFGRMGCFNSRGYSFMDLPQSPERIGVRFLLHTRASSSPRQLHLHWTDQRMRGAFDITKATRVVVHGYMGSANQPWVRTMVTQLLARADQNVVVVDWPRGARSINYFQVAANTRVVGKVLASLLSKLTQLGAPPASFHLIGLSLGAHVVGFTGSEVANVGRITGLDPAGPGFENTAPHLRLDASDAVFVDVIHSNALPIERLGLGYTQPCGTADFYPNGGQRQPGCSLNPVLERLARVFRRTGAFGSVPVCNHMRAAHFFTDSINNGCSMDAAPCSFPQVMSSPAQCRSAVSSQRCHNCVTMGYDVDLNASGVYYVRTRPQAPYCS